ncbi:Carboxypeptidase cpdS [Venturia nashicola]|uniref:Carboxypeptidase n=1 Tax=Venturia nashicola TaxID=86259 RepID=A0A4Z1NED5_9PEZI|nr:Carboxypeptidase cpdS [Venturia nashicola]
MRAWSLWPIGLTNFLYASSVLGSILSRQALSNRSSQSPYLNPRSAKFAVNGTAIPEVNFDVGESYAGLLPVSSDANETKELWFWFFPSNNSNASDEITIWLNGGPGCSSLTGLLQEHGPFLWQPGTIRPMRNQWSWNRVTNMIYIDQPVGSGFSQGKPTALGEYEVAEQFLGFWKKFIDTFQIKGRKVYVTGESYAGMYVPYIASVPMLSYAQYWQPLLRLNSTFMANMQKYADDMGYTKFYRDYFTFPRTEYMPIPPNVQETTSHFRGMIERAALLLNPCFNIYHISDTCPFPYDPHSADNWVPSDPPTYFNRTDVQKAINAPLGKYSVCEGKNFATEDGEDNAPKSIFTTLPRVFDRTPRNLVVGGALDMLVPSNGTLFSLQNTTWRGSMGFSKPPEQKLIIPAATGEFTPPYVHGARGENGRWISERGVTFVDVEGAGHQVPQYSPSAGLRLLEVLLGRIDVNQGFGGGADWSIKIGS